MGALQLKDNPLFRIHWKKEDVTESPDLKRPYKTKDFFSEWQRSMAKAQAIQGKQDGGEVKDKKVSAKSLKKAEKQKAAEDKKRHWADENSFTRTIDGWMKE